MPLAGFEPTIPVFKRAKKFHALDREATVTGVFLWFLATYRNTMKYIDSNNFYVHLTVSLSRLRTIRYCIVCISRYVIIAYLSESHISHAFPLA
jgi:hypothetical protein